MAEKPQAAGDLGSFRLKRLLKDARYVDDRQGIAADKAEDALLWDLVAEVARETRVAAPEALVLVPDAEISVAKAAEGGFALYIGVPLALALPAVELKAVVAHALAVMREPHPELAAGLVRAREAAQVRADLWVSQAPRLSRHFQQVLDDSAGFHADIERHADRAAAAVAGSRERALVAMVRAQAIAEHFAEYAGCYVLGAADVAPDLFTDWLNVAAQPVPDWASNSLPLPNLATRTAFHPGLRTSGGSLNRARQAVNPLVPASGEPVVAGFADDVSDALASFIEVDRGADYSIGYAEAGEAVLAGAGRLLGRDATPADVVDLVADDRGAELAVAWFELLAAELEAGNASGFVTERIQRAAMEPASTLGEALQVFLIAVAVRHGYRFDAVLHPGELMADGGEPIKTYAVISQAVAGDTAPLAQLVAQLAEGA
ncbi:hypothetical protein [Catenulispora pinisilvae]|uniref:hypothetical protein n=1 Tax=Catenulispora pinisilvae TaxID=2705253 RepID=UPI00189243EB|nr:hypothetical protein [Catenulispora pinisilvae]